MRVNWSRAKWALLRALLVITAACTGSGQDDADGDDEPDAVAGPLARPGRTAIAVGPTVTLSDCG